MFVDKNYLLNTTLWRFVKNDSKTKKEKNNKKIKSFKEAGNQ